LSTNDRAARAGLGQNRAMRVAVIGGGMAGLAAAHELLRGGAEPVVFEASARAGGKVASRSERGFLTEDGPNFLAQPLDALLDAAGLRAELVTPQGPRTRFLHLDGRVFTAPGLPLLRRAGVGRALLEPLFARPLREDKPLRAFLIERLGRRAGSIAAAAMAAGVYAGDPDRLSARDAFPALGAMGARGSLLMAALRGRAPRELWNLRHGLGSLPDAIAQRLGARVRLGQAVSELLPRPGGFRVQGEDFDAVVLALPAAQAAELCRSFAPRCADELALLTAAPVTLVHLGFALSEAPRGFGMLDLDGSLHALGTLFLSSMLPGRAPEGQALLTAICGGGLHPERARLPDAELIAAVRADLRTTLGIRGEPSYVRIVRIDAAIPQYAPGHRDRVRAARALLADFAGLELAGASWDGVSVPAVATSGASAANRILVNV